MNLTMFTAQESVLALMLAMAGLVFKVIATVFNAIFAFSLSSSLTGIQLLAFLAFAANVLAVCGLAILISRYIPQLKSCSPAWSNVFFWRVLAMSVVTAVVAILLTIITLVWAAIRLDDLPEFIVGRSSRTIVITWFVIWGASALLEICAFAFSAWWTRRALHRRPFTGMDLGLGPRSPEMGHSPLQPTPSSDSYRSQDPTLASPPRSPVAIGKLASLRLSRAEDKFEPASSQTRLIRSTSFTKDSAKSSLEYSLAESASTDHPFDNWDTSSVRRDIRTTLHSTKPAAKSGLETIPGSRPESPAKALDGPFLPHSSHTTASDAATVVGGSPRAASSPQVSLSSLPSSPPNFSRPGSRQVDHSRGSSAWSHPTPEPPPETLIHPLFRPNSPHPAPIAMAGTVVMASPLAGKSITPHTVIRIRSASMSQQPRQSKDSVTMSPSASSHPRSPSPGSPGPSIMDGDEEGAVIPDFVLSAGQRSSLDGYGKRKSFKGRPASAKSLANV